MSALTKRHPIKSHSGQRAILHLMHEGHVYHIPRAIAEKYEDKSQAPHGVSSQEIFANIERQYTRAGVLLRGTRHREGLTQAEMAKKIGVTQADLSKMESGKRPIGKIIAKRIEKIFDVNYRYFL